jgi:hypothetical protein
VIDSARATSRRVVLVDAGDFTGVQAASAQARGLFLVEMHKKLGYDALTLGHGDAALGGDVVRSLAADRSLPFVSANLRDHGTGKLLFPAKRVVDVDGVKVGVTAVTAATSAAGGELAQVGVDCADPVDALADVLPALRRSCDVTVLLARMPIDQAKQLGERCPDLIDVVVVGWNHPGRDLVHRENGGAVYVTAGNRGQALGRVRAALGEHRRPERIVGDEIVLGTDLPESREVAQLVAQFKLNLNDMLKEEAVRTARNRAAPDGSYYVGVAKCAECHAPEYRIWSRTRHAHAFETLIAAGSDALPECYGCHVTGSEENGGYTPGEGPSSSLVDVQCEVCHGKGSHHARDGTWGRGLLREACARCHDEANSPDFDADVYWQMIEHGRGVSAEEAGAAAGGSPGSSTP